MLDKPETARLNNTDYTLDESVRQNENNLRRELCVEDSGDAPKRSESIADKVRSISDAAAYVDKHKFGDARRDDSDEEDEDHKYDVYSPITARKKKTQDEL